MSPPQPDFDDKFRNKRIEYEASLREKEIEIDHLDQRLRERSEKLNENMTKLNIQSKENIKLKKRIEKLTEDNSTNQNMLLDKKLDLEKAFDALNILKREVEDKKRQIVEKEQKIEKFKLKQRELENENLNIENESKVITDSRENMERKLITTQQDLAIAKMTIQELEDNMKSRSQLFNEMKQKVKIDAHADFSIELEALKLTNKQISAENEALKKSNSDKCSKIETLEKISTESGVEFEKLNKETINNLKVLTEKNSLCSDLARKLKNSDNKLKEVLVKLKESEVAKQSSGKQVDSMLRKLNSKVTENDRLQADLNSERKIRIAVEENLSSCNVELESLKLQFKNEIEKNVNSNHDLETEKNKTSELQKSIESHTAQIIRWQEQLETGNEEIRKQKDVIAIRDSELIEAKHLLKLARNEINSTEVANSKLLNRVGLIQNLNSENFANQFAKISEVENELFLSKNLIKKIKKENEMYKDFLSKTSR